MPDNHIWMCRDCGHTCEGKYPSPCACEKEEFVTVLYYYRDGSMLADAGGRPILIRDEV